MQRETEERSAISAIEESFEHFVEEYEAKEWCEIQEEAIGNI